MGEVALDEGFGCETGSMATSICLPMDSSWDQLWPTYQSTLYWSPSATVQTTYRKALAYEHESTVGNCRVSPNTPSRILWEELELTDHLGLQDSYNEGNNIRDVYEQTNTPTGTSVVGFDIDCLKPARAPCTTNTSCLSQHLSTDNEPWALMYDSQDRLNRTFTRRRPSRIDENDICAEKDIQYSNLEDGRRHNRRSAHQEQQRHALRRQTQEKNRAASAKCRVKKREYVMNIQSKMQDMERINRELSSCVADLSLEVYELKRKLLLHADCNHHSILRYMWNEAQRFVQATCEHSQIETSYENDEIPT